MMLLIHVTTLLRNHLVQMSFHAHFLSAMRRHYNVKEIPGFQVTMQPHLSGVNEYLLHESDVMIMKYLLLPQGF